MPDRLYKLGGVVFLRIKKLFIYTNYDSSQYWKKRASDPGQAAVLWKNIEYNHLYRIEQEKILAPYVMALPAGATVLDIGCGIGIVAELILKLNPNVLVDAVDFPEMISVAKSRYQHTGVTYISSSAEEYRSRGKQYDLIISSACYSAIRDISKLEIALENACSMVKEGRKIIMIDPFHRWSYLARAKYGSQNVITFMSKQGLTIEFISGVLFWPFRDWLANSNMEGATLKRQFEKGEKLLKLLGRHFWADYKILVFRKK
ncbi:class I SAM-dependent methyltransferase [Methylobacillus caricis]|uniref:class I SAM-dependent methyltransferase n=1 Tax=Methylobacillus caricis TaxID=1971611 RepID=UPI001CFFD566|nr:class I SAM-dependent methyltransferase [Methylobacillus caricis]MCB5187694.1 class I SAM-dependent methyltransferase [Methylobacillus caricis]